MVLVGGRWLVGGWCELKKYLGLMSGGWWLVFGQRVVGGWLAVGWLAVGWWSVVVGWRCLAMTVASLAVPSGA